MGAQWPPGKQGEVVDSLAGGSLRYNLGGGTATSDGGPVLLQIFLGFGG